MSGRNIEILIDEIVVHGATGLDRERFRAQVEQELGRILREKGVPGLAEAVATGPDGPAQTVTLPPGQTSNASQVARAIHGSLRGARKG